MVALVRRPDARGRCDSGEWWIGEKVVDSTRAYRGRAVCAQIDEAPIDQAPDTGSVGIFIEITEHKNAAAEMALHDLTNVREPERTRCRSPIGMCVDQVQRSSGCAHSHVEHDPGFCLGGGVESMSFDADERPT